MILALRKWTRKTNKFDQLAGFRPHVKFSFQKDHFTVKTVENAAELYEALKLRSKIFFEEKGVPATGEIDLDRFDLSCDHIVIRDDRSNEFIGTYRVRSTAHNLEFYSEQEFDILPILGELQGEKMELGRACVHPAFRNGTTISLLWRGIVRYSLRTESKHLFGCSSIFTMDPREVADVCEYFKQIGCVHETLHTQPTPKYRMPDLQPHLEAAQAEWNEAVQAKVKRLIPTLVHSYIKSGAKVCGPPALDRDFLCVDFLTVLNMDRMNKLFSRRFQE